MSKQNFTPDGVQQKQNEINNLNPNEREQVAQFVADDPVNWIIDNFFMNNLQIDYLQNMPSISKHVIGWNLASAIITQIPIMMDDPTPPPNVPAGAKKSTQVNASLETQYNPNTNSFTPVGKVGIQFSW
jgi:hypothetical protein